MVVEAARTASACITCRKKKVKCSGKVPCVYCQKRGLDCEIPRHMNKRVYSVSRIEDLESRLARYEKRTPALEKDVACSVPDVSPPAASAELLSPTSLHPRSTEPVNQIRAAPASSTSPHFSLGGQSTSYEATRSTPGSTIPADCSLSSSHAFGSRVHDLLHTSQSEPQRPSSRLENQSQDLPYQSLQDFQPFRKAGTLPVLPNEEEAFRLLESVVFYIGQTQCHFDARVISDRISACVSQPYDLEVMRSPAFLQILLIFAVGKLFLLEGQGEHVTIPGEDIFEFVYGNLPNLGSLYALGRLGIELSALAAIFLQNANRKEEAYINISTALRLALSHGLHRKSETSRLKTTERTHLNRLWWTVYMQERRLAAATGNPSSVTDDIIELELPKDSPGFGPSAPLRTNIRIARVTGRITSILYGKGMQTEQTLVPNVQQIIQTLHDISQEIPLELNAKLYDTEADLPLRTAASLQLMLYQATLLTIRPIMLHVAQLILSCELPKDEDLASSALGKLSVTCAKAARRMIKTLLTLKERNVIVIFGFFDFEASFSAAFIMILAAIFDSVCADGHKITPSPGFDEALEILQHLADKGNQYAFQRLHDTRKLWDMMQIRLYGDASSEPQGLSGTTGSSTGNTYGLEQSQTGAISSVNDSSGGAEENNRPAVNHDLGDLNIFDSNLWDDISNVWLMPGNGITENVASAGPEVGISADDYYKYYNTVYNNSNWATMSMETGDFEALGRQIMDQGNISSGLGQEEGEMRD